MDITDISITAPVGALIAIGTLILTWQKVAKNIKKEQERRDAKILQEAKEEDSLMRTHLESKIQKLASNIASLESDVNKDMGHLRETYNNELKNLASKIEDLRQELKSQHGQLVTLLTKMIDPKS